jgi:tRNA A37 threonylcarbamoyladenosine dehydratase
MRVAVIGLGGAGSILVEGFARLGIGELVLIVSTTPSTKRTCHG